MSCKEFKRLLMTTRRADRTPSELERLAAHELRCEACREFAAEADALEDLLRGCAEQPAPSGFTEGVMARVRGLNEPARTPWHERIFGPLRAPTPVFTLTQAVAIAALLLMVVSVGMWMGHDRNGAPTPTISIAEGPSGHMIQMDKEFVEEVLARHQSAAAMQPLSDDSGMRLVSY